MPDTIDQAQSVTEREREARIEVARRRSVHGDRSRQTGSSCTDCGDPIPEARLQAVPGVERCTTCQSKREKGVTR